jgi:hypothetical protein
MTEGVVKYQLDFRPGPAPQDPRLPELQAWQQICHRLGLVGQDPARYDGLAYGNLSLRLAGGQFLISGTQTGGKPKVQAGDYARVEHCDIDANRVSASGPLPPSSEALTHAAVYRGDPAIGCVMHGHSPEIWSRAAALGLPATDPAAAYGTPAMAHEVARLLAGPRPAPSGVFMMAGHQDGVVAFGADPEGAGTALIAVLARALRPG